MRQRLLPLVAGAVLLVPALGAAQSADSLELRSYVVDRVASRLWIVVHRSGLLSFLGHEHAVVPTEWSADLCLSAPPVRRGRASVIVPTASLVVDSDSARALAGMGGGPGEEDRRDIQARMLDSTNLAADRYPQVRLDLRSADAGGDDERDRLGVRGSISLRGVTRDVELPVDVERRPGLGVLLSGRLRIRMRDFGIEPESRAGLVKVSNDVDLHFALAADATREICHIVR